MLPTRSSLWRILLLFVVMHLAILGVISRSSVVAAKPSAALADSTQFEATMRPLSNAQSITGTWNTELANNLNIPGTITDLVFAADGTLTVMGDFNYLNGQLVNGLATLNEQGTWRGYGLNAKENATVTTATYYRNQLYLGGRFKSLAEMPINGVARWNGTSFEVIGSGISYDNGSQAMVSQLGVMSDTLYLAGYFDRFNNQSASGLIGWRNQQIVNVPNYTMADVSQMAIVDNSMLITHGYNGKELGPHSYAILQNNQWVDMPWDNPDQRHSERALAGTNGLYRPSYANSSRTMSQLQLWQTDHWVNGISTTLNLDYMSLTQLDNQQMYVSNNQALYQVTPDAWQVVNLPMQIRQIKTLANHNNILYLAGDFTLNGQPSSLVRWDGTQLESLATTIRYANVASLGGQQGQPIALTSDFNPLVSGFNQKLFNWHNQAWQPLLHRITPQSFEVLSVDDQTSYFAAEIPVTTTDTLKRNLWQIQPDGSFSDPLGMSVAISTWTISGSQLLGKLYGGSLEGVLKLDQGQISNLAHHGGVLGFYDKVLMTDNQLYAVNPSGERGYWLTYFMKWNGINWQEIATLSIPDSQKSLQIVGWRGSLYFLAHDQLRRFNGTDSDLVATFDQVPNVLVADDDNFLYVGGPFERVDNVATGTLARWDGTTWQGLAQPANNEVTQISVNDQHLYIAGKFTHVGATPSLGVAALRFGPPENITYLYYLPQIVR